ncbi:hypothetical protein B0H11DRAFT_2230005 [Mycena galericulata]|nr:hypothetical protein B0H11DRAFT_2230005 [Mycena galericulata]
MLDQYYSHNPKTGKTTIIPWPIWEANKLRDRNIGRIQATGMPTGDSIADAINEAADINSMMSEGSTDEEESAEEEEEDGDEDEGTDEDGKDDEEEEEEEDGLPRSQ